VAKKEVILRWTERAIEHLEMLHAYVAEENAAADALIEHVIAAAERLALFPQLGRAGRVPETRELIIAGTQIIVAYRVRKNIVQVLAVIHAARRWPDSL
jgi:toxin ParE1/3/4